LVWLFSLGRSKSIPRDVAAASRFDGAPTSQRIVLSLIFPCCAGPSFLSPPTRRCRLPGIFDIKAILLLTTVPLYRPPSLCLYLRSRAGGRGRQPRPLLRMRAPITIPHPVAPRPLTRFSVRARLCDDSLGLVRLLVLVSAALPGVCGRCYRVS